MSQLFRLRLDYRAGSPNLPPTVIAKLPSTDPLLRTVFDRLGQNRREVRFYTQLASGSLLRTPRTISAVRTRRPETRRCCWRT